MESKCYYEKLSLSEEESQKRNCEIHEIINRFKTLELDMANTTNILEKVRLNSEFIKYLESLDSAYEVRISPMLDIEAHANPSIYAVGSLFDLEADQIADCFERAVDAFQDRLQQKIRSYCDINNANKRGKCYVH